MSDLFASPSARAYAAGRRRIDEINAQNRRELLAKQLLATPVYVDALMTVVPTARWRWREACHLFTDAGTDLEVLHAFAAAIGLRRQWFQNRPGRMPHYDLHANKRAEAVALGAMQLDRAETVKRIQAWR